MDLGLWLCLFKCIRRTDGSDRYTVMYTVYKLSFLHSLSSIHKWRSSHNQAARLMFVSPVSYARGFQNPCHPWHIDTARRTRKTCNIHRHNSTYDAAEHESPLLTLKSPFEAYCKATMADYDTAFNAGRHIVPICSLLYNV